MQKANFAHLCSQKIGKSIVNTAFQSSMRKTALTIFHRTIFTFLLALLAFGSNSYAQSSNPTQFVPFKTFVEDTRTANTNSYLSRAESKVRDTAAFEEMRQFLLSRYQGMNITHTFVAAGNHYDCVPIEQQPAVRKYGLKNIASPPPQELLQSQKQPNIDANGNRLDPAAPLDSEKFFDEFGNSTHCEAGAVPLLRVSLETLNRFSNLKEFFRKDPNGLHQAMNSTVDPQTASHKYSIAYQNVNNLGGNSNLNLWSPYVNTSAGEIFSLSQEWYVGGSGSGTQTEEVGWVVYPAMFSGDENAHFFIFSTADNYATGCWNSTCGDFVQVADSGLLGASFTNYSTPGGAQYDISAEYYLYQGNWWLAFQGTWIGYYPGSKYNGGQNTRYAQLIEFGTESVGTTIWPPEGSGAWSTAGFGQAAYQRNLSYIDTSNNTVNDSLTMWSPSPSCYSASGPYSSSTSAWAVFFYEGGPGGTTC